MGDSTHFNCCGKYMPGVFGLAVSIIFGIISRIVGTSKVWPFLTMIISVLLLHWYIVPIIKVDGESALVTTRRIKIEFK